MTGLGRAASSNPWSGADGRFDAAVAPVTLLVCDDRGAVRDALREVLHDVPRVARAAGAASVREAEEEARRLRPHLAIIAGQLQGGGPIAAARKIREEVPACTVVLLSPQEDVSLLLDGIRVGARGFIVTSGCRVGDFVRSIDVLIDGGVVVPPRLMGAVWERLVAPHQDEPEDELLARLTERERQVLLLLAHGGNKDSIARDLFISPKTARTHLQNIFAKLGVRSKLQAVALVLKQDWEQSLARKRAS